MPLAGSLFETAVERGGFRLLFYPVRQAFPLACQAFMTDIENRLGLQWSAHRWGNKAQARLTEYLHDFGNLPPRYFGDSSHCLQRCLTMMRISPCRIPSNQR